MFIIEVLVMLLIWNPCNVISTSENCNDNINSTTFKCTSIGNFEDVDNTTCIQYYLCKKNSSLYIIYTVGMEFDPKGQLCSETYICERVTPGISESKIFPGTFMSVTPSEELYREHISPSGAIYFESTSILPLSTPSPITELFVVNESDAIIPTSVVSIFTTETTKQSCNFISNPNYFRCSTKGRFSNLHDITCQSYFLCSLLRNGSFVKTKYNCPDNFYFNPISNVCDGSYMCPCADHKLLTTLTSSEATTELSISDISATVISSTVNESDTTMTISMTTMIRETVSEPCNFNNISNYFECKTSGRFQNLVDPTCTSYYLCIGLKNGSYLRKTYSCPGTSYFNPILHVCDTSYICPCANVVPPTTTILYSSEDATELQTVNHSEISAYTTTVYNPETTTYLSVSTIKPEATAQVCIYASNVNYFQCNSSGRFSNQNDLTCQTYFLCSLLRNGTYLKTTYNCPDTSYFNPTFRVCDTNYTCPCTDLVLNTTSSSTESVTELRTVSLSDTSASIIMGNSTDVITSLTTEAITEACHFTEDANYFQCKSKGRFSNQNDLTCQTYFMCSLLRNGSYLKSTYNCPDKSYFNPTFHVCDTSYTCPCADLVLTTTTYSTEGTSEVTNLGSLETVSSISTIINSNTTESSVPTITTEGTTAACNYISKGNYFNCNSTGRYSNQNDLTCQTYYLCSLLRNGSYLRTTYNCPEKSYFNPTIHVCDTSYTCPCADLVLTTTISSTERTTEVTNLGSLETAESIYTVINSNITVSSVPTITTEDTTVACNYTSNGNYFHCNSTGRYSNQNDMTCQTYFLCSMLRNGSYSKTTYNCPEKSYFNPTIHVCDTSYTCPCADLVLTTIITSSEGITKLTTVEVSETVESLTTVVTSEPCHFMSDANYFHCNSTGRFSNQNDLTCQTYFLCTLLRNGSYLKTIYTCPETSYFDPILHVCHTSYECPCTDLISHSTVSSNEIITSITELQTVSLPGTIASIITTVNSTHIITATGSSTSVATEITTEMCQFSSDSNYFQCNSTGRFSNKNDVTCQTYFLCSLLRNGSYLKTIYNCPGTSYFNPTFRVCDINYTCPCADLELTTTISSNEGASELTTIDPSKTTTTLATVVTTEPCHFTSDANYFHCNSTGRFSNQNDLTCQTYFLCSLLRNGSYLKTIYSCPGTSYFNPIFRVCDMSYMCPCTDLVLSTTLSSSENITKLQTVPPSGTTTSISTGNNTDTVTSLDVTSSTTEVTIDPCHFTSDVNYFQCNSTGRFLNQNDLTCRTYFLCSLLRNGSYIKTTYNCPGSSYFNPTFRVCDTSYTCPCADLERTTTISSTEGITELTTLDLSETTASITSVNNPGTTAYISVPTTTTEAATQTCNFISNGNYFQCNSIGRFLNQNDLTCQTYYLCSLMRNGSYLKTIYNCPGTSYFNPAFHVCDTTYICPCAYLKLTTTTSSTEIISELQTTTISTTTIINPDTIASENVIITMATDASTETCNFIDNIDYFQCNSTGRFSNHNDLTCQSYFLCSLLRNGSYLKTTYICPGTSYFNPTFHVCDTRYICPCVDLVLTTTISSSDGVTELPTVTLSNNSARSTITVTGPDTTASVSLTSLTEEVKTEPCHFINDVNYFQCKSTGRFSNQNDLKCQTYFLCSLLRNGSYLKTTYSCPGGSYFNPTFHVCDTNYTCPCADLVLTTAISSSDDVTESPTFSFSTATESINTVNNIEQTSVTLTTEPTTEWCNFSHDVTLFECNSTGRFSNMNDLTCQSYFLCTLLRNGSYLKTTYNCPGASHFNPTVHVCDTSYTCPCTDLLFPTTISSSEGVNELQAVTLSETVASETISSNPDTVFDV